MATLEEAVERLALAVEALSAQVNGAMADVRGFKDAMAATPPVNAPAPAPAPEKAEKPKRWTRKRINEELDKLGVTYKASDSTA